MHRTVTHREGQGHPLQAPRGSYRRWSRPKTHPWTDEAARDNAGIGRVASAAGTPPSWLLSFSHPTTGSPPSRAWREAAHTTLGTSVALPASAGSPMSVALERSRTRMAPVRNDCRMGMERGMVGRLPFIAMGAGSPMLYIGGLALQAGVEAAGTEWMNAALLEPFVTRRRVLFVNRRRGLARGMSMAELAAEHADAIRSLEVGPVDVAGLSTGGSIAQQLAADHPDVVGRLLLLCTACRLGPEGKAMQRRVAARIRRGAHRQALAVVMAALVPPKRGQVVAGALGWLAGPRLLAGGDDLADLATTIEAEDTFDLATCRNPIRSPTLILGGSEDRFYSPELFAETARLIPDSRMRVFEGRGHLTVVRHPEWTREIQRFVAMG
jgi:pimeloyl-ACP methyl ester carboxylesterase